MPFTEEGLYYSEDIQFCNTAEFSRAAQHFLKYGCYTLAPEGTREYKEFWDIEEHRRKHGMTLPGRLIINDRGEHTMQDVHVTGEYYGFLNYAQIMRTTDDEDEDDEIELSYLTKKTKNEIKFKTKIQTFPAFIDGQYHYMRAKYEARLLGKNVCVAKARRKGFSYMEGWDTADTCNLNPNLITLLAAFDLKYLTKGNQIMGMAKSYLDFLETNTDWNRGYLHRGDEYVELGYIPEGSKIPKGYRSKIIARSFKDNPDALIGADAFKIKIEEAGKAPNLLEVLEVTLSTMEDGDLKTGQMVIFGTGGTKEANWEAFEQIFYNPELYDCLSFNNIWDDGAKGTACGFYFPHRQGLQPHIDEHGNSLYDKADASIEEKRAKKKKSTKSASEYNRYVSQRSNTPRESFMSDMSDLLPNVDNQLHYVKTDPIIKSITRKGILERRNDGIIVFKDKDNVHPVTDFPLKKGSDVEGCFVFWQMPYRDKNGRVPKGLYRLWHDPYGIDKDKKAFRLKDSLAVTYIYERMNTFTPTRGDILIGSYIGRPESQDIYNENLLTAAEFVNGEIFFENNTGDVIGFAKRTKRLHLLASEPDFKWRVDLAGTYGRNKGITMTPKRIDNAVIYYRDWLTSPRSVDDAGNTLYNYHYVYCEMQLKQIQKFNKIGNFDAISAMMIGQYDIRECFDKEIREEEPVSNPNSIFERDLFV